MIRNSWHIYLHRLPLLRFWKLTLVVSWLPHQYNAQQSSVWKYLETSQLHLRVTLENLQTRKKVRDCFIFGYDNGPPRGAVEERFKSGTFFDARMFLRVIMSFCLSPSTSANWRLSWEYRSCISLNSVSTAAYRLLISNMSLISSFMSLKLLKTASSSLCCFKKELEYRRKNDKLKFTLFFS